MPRPNGDCRLAVRHRIGLADVGEVGDPARAVLFRVPHKKIVMEKTVARLREEYVNSDREALFEELKHFQPGEESVISYAQVASRLGLSESAIKSAIYRLRQRHCELLREEIADTVATPVGVDDEIRFLLTVLGG